MVHVSVLANARAGFKRLLLLQPCISGSLPLHHPWPFSSLRFHQYAFVAVFSSWSSVKYLKTKGLQTMELEWWGAVTSGTDGGSSGDRGGRGRQGIRWNLCWSDNAMQRGCLSADPSGCNLISPYGRWRPLKRLHGCVCGVGSRGGRESGRVFLL